MFKFIGKWVNKYISDVRINKWRAVIYGAVFGVLVFISSFCEKNVKDKLPVDESIKVSTGVAVIMAALWILATNMIVKNKEKKEKEASEKLEKALEEKRLKAEMTAGGKKINNKKKKKYRRKLQEKEKAEAKKSTV